MNQTKTLRVKSEIPMTRTYKYKKGEVSRESVQCGDYFVDKHNNVTVIDKSLLEKLNAGDLNTKI